MTALRTYTTVNSSTEMTVVMSAVSHVIDNKDKNIDLESCWIHFHSGKSVHVRTSFDDVTDDLSEFYKTHG
tara:strand:+ start:1120 stop:1332 length:213 start_codon:yes stop_codon:yes gene_type:complete